MTLSRKEREKHTREEEIIDAAEKVFAAKGFNDASMDMIAAQAEFTKRTLYQYFQSKEDLYFAVVLKIFKRLAAMLMEPNPDGLNGFMKIQQVYRKTYEFYSENPHVFQIIGFMGHVRKDPDETGRSSEFMNFNDSMFNKLAEVIEEGKLDGSIKSSIESKKSAYSLIFLLTGFLNELSVSGRTFTTHFEMDLEEFSRYSIDLILAPLKNNDQVR